ncbi:hypothetical protein ABZT02_44335 [Streptomyces sp. NPDC005402]|uniref:hypothetical protein n=1 Tax=Streptomyces sp. NPDC005402 TaxID=3155338 RepID=UPI0033BB3A04
MDTLVNSTVAAPVPAPGAEDVGRDAEGVEGREGVEELEAGQPGFPERRAWGRGQLS